LQNSTTYTYGYQDTQYYLTQGNGPWGTRTWTYDRIGNRLNELRDGNLDDYVYDLNMPGGHTPLLDRVNHITLGGFRDYTYGTAGHLEYVDASGNTIDFASDEAGRLMALDRAFGETAGMAYDGRSFLAEIEVPQGGSDPATTQPTYSSAGLLMSLERQESSAAPTETYDYLSFAGRPVGQLMTDSGGSLLTYLHADHLGTPFLATSDTGDDLWEGPFEPFGRDWQEGTSAGASENGVFLRFPGQWDDGRWGEADLGAEVFYNVHRWYEGGTGRYGRPDPVTFASTIGGQHIYAYVDGNPLSRLDLLGLYGTNDCSYYGRRCRESGGQYYCEDAPYWCDDFFEKPPDPDPGRDDDYEGWFRCTRKCLQDCDAADFGFRVLCDPSLAEQYGPENPDPSTESFDATVHTRCHIYCYTACFGWGQAQRAASSR
jgi:RHS repeat-associated protein